MKVMSAKEFTKSGYLQEVNRRFFHPLGLAMSVERDKDNDDECYYKFFSIIDSRDDPEGFIFDTEKMSIEEIDEMCKKIEFIDKEINKRKEARIKEVGSIIQDIK